MEDQARSTLFRSENKYKHVCNNYELRNSKAKKAVARYYTSLNSSVSIQRKLESDSIIDFVLKETKLEEEREVNFSSGAGFMLSDVVTMEGETTVIGRRFLMRTFIFLSFSGLNQVLG
ncbi:hypothetical protein OROHE_002557 [Orobanche hederae]